MVSLINGLHMLPNLLVNLYTGEGQTTSESEVSESAFHCVVTAVR